jgi:signal transduction histidine kinase
VEVRMQVPGGLVVHGSPSQLRQVFLNLVSNAVKFTEAGTVTIGARELANEKAPSAEGRWLEVWVEDTGVGIAPEELPRVFDRFYRGDAARGRPGGTGLGLAIARLLVQQHGGELGVRSEAGRGSRFRVLLPMRGGNETVDGPAV